MPDHSMDYGERVQLEGEQKVVSRRPEGTRVGGAEEESEDVAMVDAALP